MKLAPLVGGLAALLLLPACSQADRPMAASQPPTVRSSPSGAPAASPNPEPQREAPKPTAEEQAELDAELIQAAWRNDVRRARALIDGGANVNAEDNTEQSAYLIATSEGYLGLLELTLSAEADVAAKDSYNGTGLIRAADRGHADIAGRLIQAGVEVDHVNELGWTALHEAIILGDGSRRYLDTVRVLVAGGADVSLVSKRDGVSPLVHARRKGYAEIADVLRATLRAEQLSESQANRRLLAAAEEGNATAVALALRTGADLETRDGRGRSALAPAAAADHPPVVRLLTYLGARR